MACPICDKPTDKAYRPFCSKRCADVDLGKWLSGSYAIPSDDPNDAGPLEGGSEVQRREKPH
ncbi:DNA gyrase inhibitor YacG [Yoonia sp. BS5-3]|uniref:DNA gyrase inhibitor YacG n=1 Tax=Yoonia phaeophyticola TaxID=3137369 RepID=A0ABZ2V394_9RHOB